MKHIKFLIIAYLVCIAFFMAVNIFILIKVWQRGTVDYYEQKSEAWSCYRVVR